MCSFKHLAKTNTMGNNSRPVSLVYNSHNDKHFAILEAGQSNRILISAAGAPSIESFKERLDNNFQSYHDDR